MSVHPLHELGHVARALHAIEHALRAYGWRLAGFLCLKPDGVQSRTTSY